MPIAPATADEELTTADSLLELLPVAESVGSSRAIRVLPSSHASAPTAHVVTPAQPTARIHWIGGFVDLRQPADLWADIAAGTPDLVVVDARFVEAYRREHLPGAINLPWRDISQKTTAHLPREALYVVYCWDANRRASSKTAGRLEALGFEVKELHGGLEAWRKQGYPAERG